MRDTNVISVNGSVNKNEQDETEEVLAKKPKFDAINFYNTMQLDYNLSRMEEPNILTAAMRIIVRNIHPHGKAITFPIIEEVDRINLRANGITTDPKDLLELIDRVFERREEDFQLNNVYRQFVMAYGRIAFNPAEKFPACYVYTRQP